MRLAIDAVNTNIFSSYIQVLPVSTKGWSAGSRPQHGAPLKVVATGGLVPLFAGATSAIEVVEPGLTLAGLRLIHSRNLPP